MAQKVAQRVARKAVYNSAYSVSSLIARVGMWMAFGTRYKKVHLQVKQCSRDDLHIRHAWAEKTSYGNPPVYFCHGA